MRKRRFLILIFFLLISCQNQPEKSNNNKPESSKKIVSMVPSLTEILFELKLGQHIVGVSSFCSYPDSVQMIEKLGGLYDVSMEKIIRLQPDYLVIDQSRYLEQQLPKLKTINPQIVSLKTETLADIYKNIDSLGKVFNREVLAKQVISEIKDSIHLILPENLQMQKKVLIIVGRVPGEMAQIYAAGQNTYLTELADLCGLENVIEEEGYIQINSEFIYKTEMDLVLEINAGIEDSAKSRVKKEWIEFWQKQEKRVEIEVLNEDYLVIPGPRVYKGINKILKSI